MTFIIAEVGSNWTSFEDAMMSITLAKRCGADAVKFQMFEEIEMFGCDVDEQLRNNFYKNNPDHKGWLEIKRDKPTPLPKDWIPKLKLKADSMGIEFMCTSFSPEGLLYLDPYVKRHKIASSDLPYPELLRTARATGKPIFLSTGGSSLTDIDLALRILDNGQVVLLYCVSNYPSRNVNLFHLDRLSDITQKPVGYSCHTTDWYTPVSAVKHHGAVVIEKHFKIRDMETPDAPHSLLPEDFKKMVDAIRGEAACSFPDPQELEFQLKHKRRLIATSDILKGAILEYKGNFGVYRSLVEDAHGLTGFAADSVHGKTTTKDIKTGQSIGPGDFE